MNIYRPITDVWLLGRPKVKYYGAFPSGFLERARHLLGVHIEDPVLHVCSGKVRDYPFRGFGPNDKTLDLDPDLKPDFNLDAREIGAEAGCLFPDRGGGVTRLGMDLPHDTEALWRAVLVDRPYGPDHAEHYSPGPSVIPAAAPLLKRCLSVVRPGCRVGWLDLFAPRPPKGTRLVAAVGILVGYGNVIRILSVYQRESPLDKAASERAARAIRGSGPRREVADDH